MGEKPSILLVDDESAITDNLAPFLERSGFVVRVATNGEEAIAQVASQEPDLMILDIIMPKMDGRQVLRQLRGEGKWIPIILLTQVGEAGERA
jgi:DNA-binding response OmpR family regulator